jgi:uncharacterized membrane protein
MHSLNFKKAVCALLGVIPFLLFLILDTGHNTTQFAIAICFSALGSLAGFSGLRYTGYRAERAYFLVQASLNALVVIFVAGLVLLGATQSPTYRSSGLPSAAVELKR